MHFVYADKHAAAVERLYRQRRLLLDQALVPLLNVERMEQRLRSHLAAAADAGVEREDPDSEPAAFGAAAVRLLRGGAGASALALELLEVGGAVAQGAEAALSLLPSPPDDDSLVHAYHRQPALQAPLFRIFHRTARALPQGLLNTATNPDAAPAVQAAAVRYAVAHTDVAVARLREWWHALRAGEAVAAALWGSLRRRDPEVVAGLRRTLDGVEGDASKAPLLRLMALSGDPEFDDILRAYAERVPEDGARLLALRGDAGALETLCALCERPQGGDRVAAAWSWITGAALAYRPRLRMISAQGEAPASADEIPDADWAKAWWRQNRQRFEGGGAFLFGLPRTPALLMDVCYRWAGRDSHDLLAFAAVHAAPALTADPESWMLWRRAALRRTGVARLEAPAAGWRSRDPWKFGHYA